MDWQGSCLCEDCLTKEMKDIIAEYMLDLTPDKIQKVQAMRKPKKVIEGIDYTLGENGAWVFSSWYLLRQGECCDNNCTNCPYPK